jgi:hypothetical protein
MSFGWVDLGHILDLFSKKHELEWLAVKDVQDLLRDSENKAIYYARQDEARALLVMLQAREHRIRMKN